MKLVLVGKAASGKDYLKTRLKKKGFKIGVSHTTRPPRPSETDGVDYRFTDEATFKQMIEKDQFVEYMHFNGWYYGQTKEDFTHAEVMIMSKDGLDILPEQYRKKCMVIYLDIDRKTRVERLNLREDPNDSVERRLLADDEQFKGFKDFEIRITNPDF